MSRILLDTNVFMWMMNYPLTQLPSAVLEVITSQDVQLCVSVATPWEMAIKVSIGKLHLGKSIQEIMRGYEQLLEFLPITAK
mgnify:FL=1